MDINDNELDNVNIDGGICSDVNETNNNLNISKEIINRVGLGDVESSHSDGSKTVESREDRIRRLKEHSEAERQRKLAEIIESQKQSNELRQRQQMERRKKIEELKSREEERRKGVEQRRRELDEKEKEKSESLQKRSKEREARAALCQQKPALRSGGHIPNSMSQSMISPRQARQLMTTSVHSNSNSSGAGSDKCLKQAGYGRWPSSCDVDRVVVAPPLSPLPCRVAGSAANHSRCRRSAGRSASHTGADGGRKPLQPPEGFLEVDGHFIPASTRHAGCFLPFKGPRYHVRGVLAWGPPRAAVSTAAVCGQASVAWWAPAGGDGRPGSSSSSRRRRLQQQQRARSAHGPLLDGSHAGTTTGTGTDCRDATATRMTKNRSTSRSLATPVAALPSASAANATARHTAQAAMASSANRHRDDALFDRLSKPRSGSQPPKSGSKESSDSSATAAAKIMSTSFTKKSARGDSGASAGPKKKTEQPQQQHENKLDTEASSGEVNGNAVPMEDDANAIDKSPESRKHSKQQQQLRASKSPPDTADTPAGAAGSASVPLGEETAYKLKLAEQRRIAREKKEEQLGEQRRVEEEARHKAALEKKRVEEETRMLIEEEAKRARREEEERLAELDRLRLVEEADRKKRDDEQREMEEQRLEKLRLAEEERMDRKRRLEKIMSRVKPSDKSTDESGQPPMPGADQAGTGPIAMANDDGVTEFSALASTDDTSVEEELVLANDQHQQQRPMIDGHNGESPQPTEAWTENESLQCDTKRQEESDHQQSPHNASPRSDSPEQLSDTVLNLSGPEPDSHSSRQSQPAPHSDNVTSTAPAIDQAAPQFKSRLLQSMLGSGRLNATTGNGGNASSNTDKRNSLFLSRDSAGDSFDNGDAHGQSLPHSKSYQSDMSSLLQHSVANGSPSSSTAVRNESDINGLSAECVWPISVANGNGDSHAPVSAAAAAAQPFSPSRNVTGSTINCSVTISDSTSNTDTTLDPPTRVPLDLLELRSESACSPLSSDESCPPPMVNVLPPRRSQVVELS